MQIKQPRVAEAHRGPIEIKQAFRNYLPFAPQSAQTLLQSFFSNSSRIFLWEALILLIVYSLRMEDVSSQDFGTSLGIAGVSALLRLVKEDHD